MPFYLILYFIEWMKHKPSLTDIFILISSPIIAGYYGYIVYQYTDNNILGIIACAILFIIPVFIKGCSWAMEESAKNPLSNVGIITKRQSYIDVLLDGDRKRLIKYKSLKKNKDNKPVYYSSIGDILISPIDNTRLDICIGKDEYVPLTILSEIIDSKENVDSIFIYDTVVIFNKYKYVAAKRVFNDDIINDIHEYMNIKNNKEV